ncbi:MAG: InlB B-repeat-containing protein [Endomicrobiia bacterium]
MKKQYLLLISFLLFACPQQEKSPSDKTSTQTQVYSLNFIVNPLGSGSIKVTPETPGYKYLAGTAVTLEASPTSGWKFSYWSGDVAKDTSTVIVIIMNSDKTVIANFTKIQSTYTPTYTLTITIQPPDGGEVEKTPDLVSYQEGTSVTLQAISATGYVFVNWTGDIPTNLQNQNPVTITMNSNKQITANFQEIPQGATYYSLEIYIEPSDGGTVTKTPNKLYYELNEEVTLKASAYEGFSFDGWSGNLSGNQNPVVIKITGNLRITANFSRSQYVLNTSVNPPNTGQVHKNPNYEWYYPQTEVELRAVPLQGYRFVSWSGDISVSTNPVIIVMDSDKNITANFEKINQEQYTLIIQLSPNSASPDWVEKKPYKPFYSYGEQVTLQAKPPSGWKFVGWGGDINTTENPVTITITKNTTVIAYFE